MLEAREERFRSIEIRKHKIGVRNRKQFFFSRNVGHSGKSEEEDCKSKMKASRYFVVMYITLHYMYIL